MMNVDYAPLRGTSSSLLNHVGQWGVFVVWLVCVAGCLCWMSSYANKAGAMSSAPINIEPSENRKFRMHVFVHPRCPCTVSSARQLQRTLSELGASSDLVVTAYAFVPEHEPANWLECQSLRVLRRIPELSVEKDTNAEQARFFGAISSGTVLIYSPAGKLLFQGGVNAQRGHEGESAGSLALKRILSGRTEEFFEGPVFGCQIFQTEEIQTGEDHE